MDSLPQFPLNKEPASPVQGHQVPGLRMRYGKVGGLGLDNPPLNTRSLHTGGGHTQSGWREPGCASVSCLVAVHAAHAAPGPGCGLLSEPITSLPLPNARGSTNLRQVSPWLPPLQRWMGVEEEGGMQIGSAIPGGPLPSVGPLPPPTPISYP